MEAPSGRRNVILLHSQAPGPSSRHPVRVVGITTQRPMGSHAKTTVGMIRRLYTPPRIARGANVLSRPSPRLRKSLAVGRREGYRCRESRQYLIIASDVACQIATSRGRRRPTYTPGAMPKTGFM